MKKLRTFLLTLILSIGLIRPAQADVALAIPGEAISVGAPIIFQNGIAYNAGSNTPAGIALQSGSPQRGAIQISINPGNTGTSIIQITNPPLNSAHIFVGNASNVATDVAMSGDATLSNTGALTLANSGVSAGSCTNCNLTVDAKGRVTVQGNGNGGSPGGSSGDIQYNNAGSFGGETLVPIANGGTNAATAGAALTNLGAAASGTNSDITSLTALTGAQTGMFSGGAQTLSANTTLTASSPSINNCGGGSFTVTLPDATTCTGKAFLFTSSGGPLNLKTVSSQTVGGANYSAGSGFLYNSGSVGISGVIISDGANWQVFGLPSGISTTYGGLCYISNQGSIRVVDPGGGGNNAAWLSSGNPDGPILSSTSYRNQSKSTSFALTANTPKHTIITGAATVTITPTANEEWDIYNSGANAVTITTSSGSLLGTNGGSMSADGSSRQYWSDGTNVYCVGANGT